jgi:acetyltransferase-like isoleucine patch superfamily enzyme/acyl carrier protein
LKASVSRQGSAFARGLARVRLRGLDEVGDDPVVNGRPAVVNNGCFRVGARFSLSSRPVAAHIVTGPSGSLTMGDDVAIAHGAVIAAYGDIRIGDGTRIGPAVIIMDTDFHSARDRAVNNSVTPISIGRRVRIGSHVTVLRGSVVGDDASIVAGSVVSGIVPSGTRVGGVPARRMTVAAGGNFRDGFDEPSDAGAVLAMVSQVLVQTFTLPVPPDREATPSEIPQWDSLGTLSLLVALEETFGVNLNPDELTKVACVGDLSTYVARAVASARKGVP